MLKLILYIILVYGQLALTAQDPAQNVFRSNSGHVSFVSDAPLEIISAESNELKGVVDSETHSFAFQLDVRSLKGFNSPLQQEHFYENYVESEKYPVATFTGKIIETIDFSLPGSMKIRAKGIFKIHGVSQERIIPVNLQIRQDGFKASSTFMVALADHNISIPKVVYHKIAEEIKVIVEIDFVRGQNAE
jgi:hypothetical protein